MLRFQPMALFSAVALGSVGCVQGPPDTNVVLIVIDTLRADHTSLLGYERPTTPGLEQLAEESVTFEQAFSQAPFTQASHAALFTARYMEANGLIVDRLGDEELTLAEIMNAHGYATAAFVGADSRTGGLTYPRNLAQGFDVFDDISFADFESVLAMSREWLAQPRSRPFFLFVRGFDVHDPYLSELENEFNPDYQGVINRYYSSHSPEGGGDALRDIHVTERGWELYDHVLSEQDIRHLIAHYDGGVLLADRLVHAFIEYLRDRGLLEQTLLVITSDHGEQFVERSRTVAGKFVPGAFLFTHRDSFWETLRVPLLVRLPHAQYAGTRVTTLTQLIDVAPTILELLGVPRPDPFQGHSLLPTIDGTADPSFNETIFSGSLLYGGRTVISGEWQLLESRRGRQLFNLQQDREGQVDRWSEAPAIRDELGPALDLWTLQNYQARLVAAGSAPAP